MRIPVGRYVTAESPRDAIAVAPQLAWMLSRRRLRRLERAPDHSARDALLRSWSDKVLRVARTRVVARGLDRFDPAGVYLVLPLHESLIDVPLLISRVKLPMTFVARQELTDLGRIGSFITASRQVLIEPESGSSLRTVMRSAALLAAQGRSLAIFAQGSVLGIEVAFQSGAAAVAEQLQVPVLPVVISGTHRVWDHPFDSTLHRNVEVSLEVLEPRRIAGPDGLRELEREMKGIALESATPPRRFEPERDGFWDGYSFDVDQDYPELAARVAAHRATTRS